MCFYCKQTLGHHPSCLFAEPAHVLECDRCDSPIYEDEQYLEIDSENICKVCYEGMLKYAERNGNNE